MAAHLVRALLRGRRRGDRLALRGVRLRGPPEGRGRRPATSSTPSSCSATASSWSARAGRASARSSRTCARRPQVDGANTQNMMVYVDDVEAHCKRARDGGRDDRERARDPRLRRGLLDRSRLRVPGPRRPPLVVLPAPAQPESRRERSRSHARRARRSDAAARRRSAAQAPRRAGELADALGMQLRPR